MEQYHTVDKVNIQNEHYERYLINKTKALKLIETTLKYTKWLWQTRVLCIRTHDS